MSSRVCPDCKIDKDLETEYQRSARSKDGRQVYCRPCQNARNATVRARRIANPEPAPEAKVCPACGIEKSADEFYKSRGAVGGLFSYCKDCDRHRIRLLRYGLTREQYEEMVEAQQGCCALCGREEELVVDHSHASGAVRALLCGHCNRGIGHFFDSTDLLRQAIIYLEQHDSTRTTEEAA